jgi:regulator of PEP synthase PpsR (kinase-PPPase family)
MQKSLTQMNLQIQHVISDITGTTGLAIIDAILAGFTCCRAAVNQTRTAPRRG